VFVVQIILRIREGIDKMDWSGSRLPINHYFPSLMAARARNTTVERYIDSTSAPQQAVIDIS
jgi:hypothetical protein